jgi:hypothetical protein
MEEKMHEIIFPSDFDEYEWLINSRGYISDIIVLLNGDRYALNIYDSVRFSQDLKNGLSCADYFFEPNVVILPELNRENIISCINRLVSSNQMELFCPEKPVDENGSVTASDAIVG